MPQFGLVLANSAVAAGSATSDDLLRMAGTADAVDGFSHVWVGDSLLASPRFESTVLLAAIAARTRRVRLGLGCMVSLGLRDPIVTAIQWAGLDVLSGGRMTLVACNGPTRGAAVEHELAAFSMTHPEKVRRTEEAIELIRTVSRGGVVDFDGDHIQVTGLEVVPGFVQQPLPIWMAANPSTSASESTVRRVLGRVARLGDGWMTFGLDPALLRARVDLLAEIRQTMGGVDPSFSKAAPYPVCVYVDININPDSEKAVDDAVATRRAEGRAEVTADAVAQTGAVGSVDACVDFVGKILDAGANDIALRPVSADPDKQVQLIAEHLLPQLQRL